MATKEPTQKPPFKLKAQELKLTEQTNDYYLQPELVKCLYVDDIAAEVAALSTRQEDPEDIARILRQSMQRMMWYLSSGYSVSTPLGYFRPTAQGVFLESELNEALDRSRLELGVKYSMGEEMRQALEEADIAVTVTKAASGPQLYSVVSGQDAENPEAATRGEGTPVSAGQTCVIKGRNIKVGGTDEEIGVTLTRVDGDTHTTVFFPLNRLYPNTRTRVGFVMPADAPQGSVWSVTLCTQLANDGHYLLKKTRTVTMDTNFVVGEVSESIPGGEDDDDSGQGTFG